MRQFTPFLVCAILCVTSALAQQPQTPSGQPAVTFKAEVDYVDVDTIVTDQQGRFISDLKKDDFEIFEDGKAQKIEMFSYVNLPLDRPDRLVYASGRSDAAQEFTSDRSLLLAAVDKFVGRKLRSAMFDKIDEQYRQGELKALAGAGADPNSGPAATNSGSQSSGSSTDPNINPFSRGDGYPDRTFDSDDLERGYRALRVLGELKQLSDFMGNIHGRRKALLLFSEGIDYDTSNVFGAQEATQVVKAM